MIKGLKEAKWNNKYMKIIEKPVKTIEQAKDLKSIVLNISALMNTLANIKHMLLAMVIVMSTS